MTKPATDRLKLNPPLGMMPALQYLLPVQLHIDDSYQRSLDAEASKALVRSIAQHWNWDLCQPLVVSRRSDGALYVIDGQHRLAAAKLRGDIQQLPAVVVQYASAADEAASFVNLNQQRRPLSKIDMFKAACASGDTESIRILAALRAAGLSIATTTNPNCWKPGMISNIGGIQACWRRRGGTVTELACKALGEGFPDQILRYAGTIFPGLGAVIAIETNNGLSEFDDQIWPVFIEMVSASKQERWRSDIMQAHTNDPSLKFSTAAELVFTRAWREVLDEMFDDVAPRSGSGALPIDASDRVDEGSGDDAVAGDGEEGGDVEDMPPPILTPPSRTVAAKPAPKPVASAPVAAPAPQKPNTSVRNSRPVMPTRLFNTQALKSAKVFETDASGKGWCNQCDCRRTKGEVATCRDRFCPYQAKR